MTSFKVCEMIYVTDKKIHADKSQANCSCESYDKPESISYHHVMDEISSYMWFHRGILAESDLGAFTHAKKKPDSNMTSDNVLQDIRFLARAAH